MGILLYSIFDRLRPVIFTLVLLGGVAAVAPGAQAPAAPAPPQVAERDQMTLTILQQQLQIAILQLKVPGWHVELVGGRWSYVPDPPDQKP